MLIEIEDIIMNVSFLLMKSGWSLNTETSLLRDDEDSKINSKIGALLKGKAEAGLKVCV